MSTKPSNKNKETESLQEQIIKLEKQLESFKHSNDHFLKNKLFLHYDIKEPEKVVVDCEMKLPVLEEVDKKKIQKGKESDPTHLIIEGDNYHALSVLNYTHAGKIDLIYIDPPYNTGNKDFIYNDRFIDREDSFRHSMWLSFMAHRLRLAKNLLAETGVIFISIDDNEQAHLRLLCDQIFGEENFVSLLVIETANGVFGSRASQTRKTFVKVKDYVLVYVKSVQAKQDFQPLFMPTNDRFDTHFSTMLDENYNKASFLSYIKNSELKKYFEKYNLKISLDNISKLMTIDETFNKIIVEDLADKIYQDIDFSNKIPDEVDIELRKGKTIKYKDNIIFRTSNGNGKVRFYSSFRETLHITDDYNPEYRKAVAMGDLWEGFDNDMKNVAGEGSVDFKNGKKPARLIEQLIKWYNNDSATILDFFAGSGTTGHAVLKLNAKDSGTRQFILCSTNDEKEPIVDKVLYPRIKKVIDGYGDTAGISANLRYFQTDFVEKKEVHRNSRLI